MTGILPHSRTSLTDDQNRTTRDYYDFFRRLDQELAANNTRLDGIEANPAPPGLGGGGDRIRVVQFNGTAKTLLSVDDYTAIECLSTTAVTITVAPDSLANWPADAEIYLVQGNIGQVTLVAGAGVTLDASDSLKTRTRESTIGIKRRGANLWQVIGDTEPVAPARSVLVRSAATDGAPAFLAASADGEVLTRVAGVLQWQTPAGSGDLDTTLTYNLDGTLNVVTTSAGTKTMGYTGDKLTSITGTGIYQSKTFTYTGDQLTGIDVL